MTHFDPVPLDQLDSARNLHVDHQARCLLTVIAPMLQAMQDAQSGSVESTLQLHETRQAFRECVESLCRPLSADETQNLFVLTMMSLCERLVDSSPIHYG